MSSAAIRRLSPDEYLAMERASDRRHEYLDGFVTAMAGGSSNHSLITTNTLTALKNGLAGRTCRVFNSDMRVGLPKRGGGYFYPDIAVTCDRPEMEDSHQDVLLNPLLIVEVLSPSTEAYDRGVKFKKYRTIPTLKVFALIWQDQPFVEVHERKDFNRWETTFAELMESSIQLPVLGITLSLADLYEFVEFPPPTDPPRPFADDQAPGFRAPLT